MHSQGGLPEFSNDLSFRVYVRYNTEADLELLKFEDITERYISEETRYVVGRVNLATLHAIRNELAERKIFIAAYPAD